MNDNSRVITRARNLDRSTAGSAAGSLIAWALRRDHAHPMTPDTVPAVEIQVHDGRHLGAPLATIVLTSDDVEEFDKLLHTRQAA